ncbi:MAG: DUF997 family protein [Candidatus Aminicenantes bacterium]|nr:MAG: DUF997 family protein [Candidatus Aminicenantes bacterium]
MKFIQDPRIKVAKRGLAIAWIFFAVYLIVILVLSYVLGIKPYIFGLPRWVAIGNLLIPIVFVIALIFVAEKLIPDIPLTDNDEEESEEK